MLLSKPEFTQATEGMILAWQKLRPAPKVSIDFGDGHKLERTLKGSTVTYLCRPDGKVIDAYPGLYTSADFLPLLSQGKLHLQDTSEQLRQWHLAQTPAPEPRFVTTSKALLESPLLNALGNPAKPPSGTAPDLSLQPLSRNQVLQQLAAPPDTTPEQLVALDSQRYLVSVRPLVQQHLAQDLRTPEGWMRPLFTEVLQVPIDDPYLGLKVEGVPGTP